MLTHRPSWHVRASRGQTRACRPISPKGHIQRKGQRKDDCINFILRQSRALLEVENGTWVRRSGPQGVRTSTQSTIGHGGFSTLCTTPTGMMSWFFIALPWLFRRVPETPLDWRPGRVRKYSTESRRPLFTTGRNKTNLDKR